MRIIQYPPLFLSARTTKESVSGSLNNKSMYIVNVLVANLSDISSTIIKNGSETDKAAMWAKFAMEKQGRMNSCDRLSCNLRRREYCG